MLENKKIIIAGAGGLLGSKLASAALVAGAEVIATDKDTSLITRRLPPPVDHRHIERLHLVELDVNNESQIRRFFDSAQGVSGAVNCTYPRTPSYGMHFFDVTLDSFNENVSAHLGSAFLFSQQCAAYFLRTGSDFSLVNIASIYGVCAPKFDVYKDTNMTMPVEYAAIKSAIVQLGRYISAYVRDSRFRVNTVSPAGILDNQPSSFLEAYRRNTNGRGMLDADDVVGAILFLLSNQSRFITGQNIIVDDGFTL